MSDRKDVENGTLIYTCVCGWVDLGHANPENARKLWKAIVAERGLRSADNKGFMVSFAESASKFGVPGQYYGKSYWVRRGLTKAQKESVALSIFMEVSVGFEGLQSALVFRLFSDSGFSAEDLVSDLIGFYRAVRPEPDYKALCKPVKQQQALAIWDKYGAVGSIKNHEFAPILFPCDDCPGSPEKTPKPGKLPLFLNLISPARKGENFRDWNFYDSVPSIGNRKVFFIP